MLDSSWLCRFLRLCAIAACVVISGSQLFAWGRKQHTQILDAALTAVSEKDHLPQRLGNETWQLRYYVQMGDWYNAFVSESEEWTIRDESFGHVFAQFYANDFQIFPKAPAPFYHAVPGVLGSYRPFFFRALQALRTESPSNAARWVGSLLHFVTDSGSPPHTLDIHGETHVKMETWVDASRIDLSGYRPRLLGSTDAEAADGLIRRMNGLIQFSRLRAQRMLPLAQANDRAALEPIALEAATETAKVTADVLHTLFVLTNQPPNAASSSLAATISAPPVAGMKFVPAKLMLIGTDYSTLSEPLIETPRYYRGSFILRDLPPGSYRAIIERTGAQSLFSGPLVLRAGQTLHLDWRLRPSDPAGNLVRNPRFKIRWTAQDVPDQWRFDKAKNYWLSDNVPIEAGKSYRVGFEAKASAHPDVKLQWMAAHWGKPIGDPVQLQSSSIGSALLAPSKAFYARFIVAGSNDPASSVEAVFLAACP